MLRARLADQWLKEESKMKRNFITLFVMLMGIANGVDSLAATKKKSKTSRKPAQSAEWPVTNCKYSVQYLSVSGEIKQTHHYVHAKNKTKCQSHAKMINVVEDINTGKSYRPIVEFNEK